MKNKIKTTEPNALSTGVFKKRKWPWLLVIAGVLCPLLPLALYAKEFFIDACPYCETFSQHLAPNASSLIAMVAVFVVFILLAIICTVYPKRSLIVTACKIIYKKGRKKETRVPFTSIDRIDVLGSDGIIVYVSTEKFKFKKLKNRKEVYDALLFCIEKNAKAVSEINNISVGPDKEATLSKLAESKIRYFKNLLNSGAINEKQFADYVEKALETK